MVLTLIKTYKISCLLNKKYTFHIKHAKSVSYFPYNHILMKRTPLGMKSPAST